jgi:hypothetical protein
MRKPGYRRRAGKVVVEEQRIHPRRQHGGTELFDTGIEHAGRNFSLVPGQ